MASLAQPTLLYAPVVPDYAVAIKKLDSIVGHMRRGKQSFIEGLCSDLALIF